MSAESNREDLAKQAVASKSTVLVTELKTRQGGGGGGTLLELPPVPATAIGYRRMFGKVHIHARFPNGVEGWFAAWEVE